MNKIFIYYLVVPPPPPVLFECLNNSRSAQPLFAVFISSELTQKAHIITMIQTCYCARLPHLVTLIHVL